MSDPLGDAIKRRTQPLESLDIERAEEEGFILPTFSTAPPPTFTRPRVGINRVGEGQPQRPLSHKEIQAMGRRGVSELGGFETIGRTGTGLIVEGVQKLLPGEQLVERRVRELRDEGAGPLEARRAALEFEGEDALPSTTFSLPFRVPLLFGRSLQDIDIGVQGALETIFDPLELLPGGIGVGLASRVFRKGVKATATRTAANASKFAAPLREFDEVVSEVVTSTNPIVRTGIGHTGINPAVLENTEIGQGIIAYSRQQAAIRELSEVTVGSALDAHRAPISGKIPINIDKDGFVTIALMPTPIDQKFKIIGRRDVGKLWNDVFSQEDLPASITGRGREFINDFRQVIDEVEQMRVDAGLKPRAKNKEGWYYIPRQTDSIREIELLKQSDPNLARIYDEATEGFANGIRYNADPVETLKIHVRQAYKEILNKQLSDYLEPLSITGKDLLEETNPAVIRAYEDAIRAAVSKAFDIRRMQNQMRVLQIGGGETGGLKIRTIPSQASLIAPPSATRLQALEDLGTGGPRMSLSIEARAAENARIMSAVPQNVHDAIDRAIDDAVVFTQKGTGKNANVVPLFKDAPLEERRTVFSTAGRFQNNMETARRLVRSQFLQDLLEEVRIGRPNTRPLTGGLSEADRRIILGTVDPSIPAPRVDIEVGAGLAAKVLRDARALNRKDLQANINKAKAELVDLRSTRDKTRRAYTNALEAKQKTEIGPGNLFGQAEEAIQIKKWHNRFFPVEDAKKLQDALGDFGYSPRQANFAAETFGKTVNTIRFLASVGDFAAPFIQGLPVLARNPNVWARASLRHYQAFFDPTVQARLMRSYLGEFQEMARHGVPVGDPEFFRALEQGGSFSPGKLLELLPKGGKEARSIAQFAGRQTFGRFQASYNTFLGSSRAMMWRAMKDSWVESGGSLDELGAYIKNMTGGLNSRALGVGPSHAEVEATWLAFSPRLLRSTIALVSDAFRGVAPGATVRQRESLRTMAQLVTGVTGAYVASGLALGKNWEEIGEGLNPLNGKKFLSHQINGDWIGVGGQVRALLQFMTHLTSSLAPGGEPIGDLTSLNLGDPNASLLDNPLIAFLLFRGAPGVNIAGAAVEGLTGGAVDVLPFDEIDSLPDAIKHMGTSALPFAIQGRLEGEGATAQAFGALGGRTSAETPADRRNEARAQEMERKGTPGKFEGLDRADKAVIDSAPAVVRTKKEVRENLRERGSTFQAFLDNQSRIIDDADRRILEASERRLDDGRPGEAFRDTLSRELELKTRRLNDLRNDPESKAALAFLEELEPSELEFDKALEAYQAVVFNTSLTDFAGDFDFERLERDLDATFRAVEAPYDETMLQQIIQFNERNDNPLQIELNNDRDTLSTYFDLKRKVAERRGVLEKYEEYLSRSGGPQEAYRRDNEDLAAALEIATAWQRAYRAQDPTGQIEFLLWKWQYGPFSPAFGSTTFTNETARQLAIAYGTRQKNRQAGQETEEFAASAAQ